ncbi:molybdopterin-dependent oxidoreductase [Rubellimicrobium aerolatum]|uniref:Molybdopterin-dependent oxidoreductase n=1 Tax=Rubellimicrobium aerolatum TaxID=490979 RepID=A0ABW0S998_9RHOB|nr:assimilatory nitrate reductase catalytic subunit [Rubellimicrobium aerolatum]
MSVEVRTTCPYCGVGCGVLARLDGDRAQVRGDPDHPANLGRLCSKGAALAETLALGGRLLQPEVAGRPATWDAALDLVARRFTDTIAQHGPDSVGFYVSGQLLTEDYYLANKLMKGFLGSANIDTNSRLCMASSVAGHRRAFGEDIVPGTYEDLEQADLVVLVGSNLAWCHPVLHQRLLAARAQRGTRIVVIDPRRSAAAEDADLHLPLRPGSDVLLFNGLLAHLAATGATDPDHIAQHTTGFADTLALAQSDAPDRARVAKGCDLHPADLARFYDWFATTPRTVTVYSQGVNQSAHGTDKVNAILNCHLATGRIGREGMGPFSITGQPNAMGGREVGGLANQLAAHMAFTPAETDRVSRFWTAPNIAMKPGLKAVEMFEAARTGRLKALWIMGTNPATSMPDATRVREALRRCPFVVVSDVTRTDTTRFAHVILPAAAWGEKDGTVTNSERRISRQRAFLPLPGEARPDWEIIAEAARRMGFADAFPYQTRAEIFREHAALTAFENDGDRLLDLGALSDLPDADYDALPPTQWPARRGTEPGGRLLATRVPTPDGRARLVPVRHEGPARPVDRDFPIALTTGRLRDQWHTMTRTGLVPRLMAHAPEPVLDLARREAQALALQDGDLVQIDSPHGQALARLRISDALRPGEAFLPMHWSGLYAARASSGPVSNPATDAHSGQPELKHVPIRVTRATVRWSGLLLTKRDLRPTGLLHWSRAPVPGGWAYELAGAEPPAEGTLLARALLPAAIRDTLIDYADKRAGTWRAAALDAGGRLTEALLVAPPGRLPDRAWLLSLLADGQPLAPADRRALLSGRAPTPLPDKGRIVCACMNVGLNDIASAVRAGATTVEAIGQLTRAGTNCGSCRSEIRELIHAQRLLAAE